MKNKQLAATENPAAIKQGLHPRNLHRGRYDFDRLVAASPELAAFVAPNAYGSASVDFSDPAAVRALNRALLIHCYGIAGWDIPANYLCPPIPGRADYLHHAADLLADSIATGDKVRALDIGTGANCIYPLIGHSVYCWQFVASDIDAAALKNAQRILDANPGFCDAIELRLQPARQSIFEGIVGSGESFDLTLCNPPFHASQRDADAGTRRKWNNLGIAKKSALNFGGQGAELWCPGGEEAFLCRMIDESRKVDSRWFTSLVSKAATLPALYRALQKAGARHRTIPMSQGQKQSRLIAWRF